MSLRYGWWMAAALWTAQPAFAADQIGSIEEEPKHVLKFQNRHVRYFDMQLPRNAGNGVFHGVDIAVK